MMHERSDTSESAPLAPPANNKHQTGLDASKVSLGASFPADLLVQCPYEGGVFPVIGSS
jgi:hypothetical protein